MIVSLVAAACAIAVVGDDDAFVESVRAELASTVPCVEVARTFEPRASNTAVRLVSRSIVEVWEHDALANVLQLRGSEDVDVVKIAEHVRARSVALVPRSAAAPTADAAPPSKPVEGRFSLAAGVGPVLEAGAVTVGARVAIRSRIVGPLGAGATLVAALAPATVSGADGEADVSTLAARPTLDLEFRPDGSSLRASFGLGGLFAVTRATGVTTSPLQARRVSESRFVPALVTGAAYGLTPHLALELAAIVGAAVPALEVRFAGTDVARWGAPYFITTGGAVVTF